jgi:hypothetical protein
MKDLHRKSFFTPAKTSLLMLGIATVSLMGIPGVTAYQAPSGALTGVVVEHGGQGLEEIPVALFDADDLSLLEVTHSDDHGYFAFQQAPSRFHVFANPPLDSPHVSRWALSLQPGFDQEIEITLDRGHRVTVTVLDEMGTPIEGAEVRAYEVEPASDRSAVVVRTRTDEGGEASFACPELAHLGVIGAEERRLNGWSFDQEISPGNDHFEFTLPGGTLFHGKVLGAAERPLEGILVSSWDRRDDSWQWNGYELTDDEGRFDLRGADEESVFRAVDLTQSYLPSLVQARKGRRMNVVLGRGEPLEIHCASTEMEGIPSRVWVWSDAGGTWSWGSRTDAVGTLHATVSDRHAVVARPLDGSFTATAEAWNQTYEGEQLELTHEIDHDH